MPVFDLFSKRQKRLRGETPEILVYDIISKELRVRICHIMRDVFGRNAYGDNQRIEDMYEAIHMTLCREYGRDRLIETGRYDSDEQQVHDFLREAKDTEQVLDVIELAFRVVDKALRPDFQSYSYHAKSKMHPDQAIDELNERFKEEGVGYSFESGELIRIDSTYIHKEVVIPSLSLIRSKSFSGVNDEYLSAHEHYRNGKNKECLTDCLKAFESTMKTICDKKGWKYDSKDTSKKLIQTCFQKNLIPSFTQNQFTSLQSLLESGIPTIRNRLGGHGQGPTPQKVDDEMTRYALNLTGANIIFLIEQSGIK